jgi:hypothetical protein
VNVKRPVRLQPSRNEAIEGPSSSDTGREYGITRTGKGANRMDFLWMAIAVLAVLVLFFFKGG